MKWYPKTRPWLIASMCLLMCGCEPEPEPQPEPEPGPGAGTAPSSTTYQLTVSGECKATDVAGAEIAQIDLVAGQMVTYCNKWSARATISFSVVGFLPCDAIDMTLEPGECVAHIVNADVVDGDYLWSLSCEGYSGGMGGGPVKVDNPPPGP